MHPGLGDPEREKARRLLDLALEGVGNPEHFRFFRMQMTYCMHRAVSDFELTLLPPEWATTPGQALAGGPVEMLEWGGMDLAPSALPCDDPEHLPVPGTPAWLQDPHRWLPGDCGKCEPCRARAAIEAGMGS